MGKQVEGSTPNRIFKEWEKTDWSLEEFNRARDACFEASDDTSLETPLAQLKAKRNAVHLIEYFDDDNKRRHLLSVYRDRIRFWEGEFKDKETGEIILPESPPSNILTITQTHGRTIIIESPSH